MKALLASSLALVVLAAPALAQHETAPPTPYLATTAPTTAPSDRPADDPTVISPRLVGALGASSVVTRAAALHAITTLAYSAEGADLKPAIPALLSAFETETDERLRLLALRSLETTGDDAVMATLRNAAGSESYRADHPAVQRLLFAILVDHYGVDALRHDRGVGALVESLSARTAR